MNAATETTNNILRSTVTSVIVSALSAVALALAFPKAGQAWLAPLAAAGLFWAWQHLSWKRAFFTGWFAGTIFFCINFSWFTHTVGSYVGPFAFGVVLIPALVEGLTFAAAAVAALAAERFAPQWAAPAAAAAAFTIFEWLRSIGALAVPFAQIGYSQTATPLIVFAPYIGAFGVTFIVMLLGAYVAQAIDLRTPRALFAVIIGVTAAAVLCFAAWPARHRFAEPPLLRVAAVQGNIAQTVKWNPQSFWPTVNTYLAQTRRLQPQHPQLIVLPETVIPTDLNMSDPNGVRAKVRSDFSELARNLNTTLVVGSLEAVGPKDYNALYVFNPSGTLSQIYQKRQLVPFAESFPGEAFLRWLPSSDLIGRFAAGQEDAVITAGGVSFAPLICWESAFADLVHAQVAHGAQFLVIATDDAWFGETSGTYQHAQIAQMRAIENGQWALQSAATGISGIVAPDGTWTQATALDKTAILSGEIRAPTGSFFALIGPTPVGVLLVLAYAGILAFRPIRARMPARAPQPRPAKFRWKLYAAVAGAILLIWVIAGVILAGNEPGGPPQGLTPLTLHGGRVTGNRISTKSWTFDYDHAEMSADGVLATVQGIRRGVLYKGGKPYLTVRAEQVSANTQTFDFTATGAVHVAQTPGSGSERTFDTDLIQWNNASKTLALPHPSIVRGGGETLRVSSINVNFNSGEIHFGRVSGAVSP